MARPRAVPVHSKAAIVPPEYHADFLKRFVVQENRAAKRPAPPSVEEHAAHRKRLTRVHFIKPKLAYETDINVGVIFLLAPSHQF
jgi:hypothetical protein